MNENMRDFIIFIVVFIAFVIVSRNIRNKKK